LDVEAGFENHRPHRSRLRVFPPDVFDGVLQVSGSIKVMRRDLVPFIDAIAETVVTMSMTAQTPGWLAKAQNSPSRSFTFQQAVKSDSSVTADLWK